MSKHGAIHVVTLADDRYAMPLAVMGRSLLENCRSGRTLKLTIIDGGISEVNRARVERSWVGASPGPAEWRWVPPAYGAAKDLPVWGRVPALTYARLIPDSYAEADARRLIVLDSDTLVLADIAGLYDEDLAGAVAGACVDPFIPSVSATDGLPDPAQLGIAADTPYFNAGILVVDLERYLDEDVGRRALEYLDREQRRLRQYDQDCLNAVLAGRWKRLDDRWNVQPRTLYALGTAPPPDARIVHFSGRLKPWLYRGGTRPDRLYFEYLDRTDWSGFRVPLTWRSMAYRVYDTPVRRVLHAVESRGLAAARSLSLRFAPKSQSISSPGGQGQTGGEG